jgi:putative nucleotidyltransferase with HDIG domain
MSQPHAREQLQKLAARLQAALQCQQIYPPKHPRLAEAVAELEAELRGLFDGDEPLRIAYVDREFVLNRTQIAVAGEVITEFASLLYHLGVEKLVFAPGFEQRELLMLLDLLGRNPEDVAAAGGIEEEIDEASLPHIEIGTITVDPSDAPDPDILFRTWESYSAGLKIMRGIKSLVRESGKVRNAAEVRELAFGLTALAMQETRPLLFVHSLMQHDEYSFTHSLNVAFLTLALAQNLPFDPDDLHEITVAALLHDVGKERIPGEILRKPGKLDPEEWEIINTHGLEGARMLAEADGIGDLAPLVAYEHHLAYHEELRGDDWEPHLVSQLVSIADVYDALRSIRPYRGEILPDKAMRIMEEDAGTKFEPSLFACFRAMVGFYPPGCVLRLESGRFAVSFYTNPHTPELPQVVLVGGEDDESDPAGKLDLAAPDCNDRIAEVVRGADHGIDPVDYL